MLCCCCLSPHLIIRACWRQKPGRIRDKTRANQNRIQRGIREPVFRAWSLIDYGRSLGRLALGAFVVTMFFGFIFHLDSLLGLNFFEFPTSANSPLTPYYFSIVTFTRLGSGGITPLHWVGEIVLICERILGYVTLGLLLSILANKVARRS